MRHTFVLIIIMSIILRWCESTFRYFLYVGGNDTWSELPSNGNISDPLWVSDSNLKVLIHGYNSNETAEDMDVINSHMMPILATEYKTYDSTLNVVVVDWKSLATFPHNRYFETVQNVKPAGTKIAHYLMKLLETGAVKDLDSIHILGFSMGAHVAGAVGYDIQNREGGEKVARITGLDPAGPGFSTWNGQWPSDLSIVLDSTDAEFVDIIHTNMGRAILEPVLSGALGTELQTGHIDFYPNGGEVQKEQCTFWDNPFDTCSHSMCVLIYAQALRHPHIYTGCPCDNYEIFLSGRCFCMHNVTGQLLGDLTSPFPPPHGRYYMTIKDVLSKVTFEE